MAMAMTTAMAKAKEEVSYADPSLVLDKEQICSFALLRGMEIEKEEEQAKEKVSYAAPSVGLVLDKEQICSFAEFRGMEIEKDEQLITQGSEMVDDGKALCQRNQERLREMVSDMERMERILRSDDSQPLTLMESNLYQLINWHTMFCISMFHLESDMDSEESLCFKEPTDMRDRLVNCLFESYCVKNSGVSSSFFSEEAYELSKLVGSFHQLLKKARLHFLKTNNPHAMANMDVMEIITRSEKRKDCVGDSFDFRVRCLAGILRGLEDMARARTYAPPKDGEIQFYRKIRKSTHSSLIFMVAKRKCFKRKCQLTKKKWCEEGPDMSTFYSQPFIGTLYRLASALDEFPDILSIFKERKFDFVEIVSRCSNEEKPAVEALYIEACESKLVPGVLCSNKKMKCDNITGNTAGTSADDNNAAVSKGEVTRERLLLEILQLLEKMGPLTKHTQLQVEELRFYVQIMEHVHSSIGIYNTVTGEEACSPIDYRLGIIIDSTDNISDHWATNEPITREQCFSRIMMLIETIRSYFMCVPPTEQEMVHYRKMKAQLPPELLQGCGGASSLSASAAMTERHLRFVYDCELSVVEELKEDFREMVRSIYEGLIELNGFKDPLKFLEEFSDHCKKSKIAISELKNRVLLRPHGLGELDRLIVITESLNCLWARFFVPLVRIHAKLNLFLDSKEVAAEASLALQVVLQHPSSPL